MVNNKIYMHITPNNKIYIGITSTTIERRWRNNGLGYRNQYFYRAIEKYGWDNIKHIVLFTNLSKKEVEQKEIELIAKYKSNNRKYGYNIDNGGYLFSKEHLKNLSESHKGYKHTKKTKEKMSKRMMGNKYALGGSGRKGYKLSEEEKEHLRNTKKCKEVVCIELNKTFRSIHQAANETKTDRRSIQRCCNNKLHTANGYHWKYKGIS